MPLSQVLKQIRTSRRFDLAAVAHATGISSKRLQEFEDGKSQPTSRQFETLAETYGVPGYLLGLDLIPNLPEAPKDFRKADPTPANLSPTGMQRIWAAEQVSQATTQLVNATKASLATWTDKIKIPAGNNLSRHVGAEMRAFFDDWLSSRADKFGFTGTDEQKLFGALRLFIEAQGTIVRVNQASPDDFMGFYLEPEDGAPTAFVNRKISSQKAQLFTLVHEYAHSLVGASGVSDPFRLKNDIERMCNQFAAEFIAPTPAFTKIVEALDKATRIDVFKLVAQASRLSLLSRHATAIRLLETGHIDQKQLNQWLSARAKLSGKDLKKRGP